MPYTYAHPRPALSVDCVLFGYAETEPLQVLLVRRGQEPFAGCWALPGGFVEPEEGLEAAARRELQEETGVRADFMEQLYTFGDPGRDPRGRVVSVAYYALVNLRQHAPAAASDARQAAWYRLDQLPALAFDHAAILDTAIRRLRAKVRYQPIGFGLLPERFTLSQLQRLYETLLGVEEPLNKRNFRTRILRMGVLREVGRQKGVPHRPARLYTFDQERYERLRRENQANLLRRGVDFEI